MPPADGPEAKGGGSRPHVAPWAYRASAATTPTPTPTPAEDEPAEEAVRRGIEGLLELGDSHLVPPIVLGEEGPPLSEKAYVVYLKLIDVWPGVITEGKLAADTKCGGVRWILEGSMKKDPNIKAITRFPGRGGRGIGISHPAGPFP